MHCMESRIQQAVKEYKRARSAVQRLGSLDLKYQDITKDDLKMPGDVVEENRIGQRSEKLSWLWRLDGGMKGGECSERMKECEWTV